MSYDSFSYKSVLLLLLNSLNREQMFCTDLSGEFHNWKAPLGIALSPLDNIPYNMAPDIWEMGLSSLGN